jgi:DNA-binding CsgD family transcriptional regulator
MLRIELFNEIISAIYDFSVGSGDLKTVMRALCHHFEANSAGLSFYDRANRSITRSLYVDVAGDSASDTDWMESIGSDPGAVALGLKMLRTPHRLQDIVPIPRLQVSNWFRSQVAKNGLGRGMIQDLMIGTMRTRIFIMRGIDLADFTADQLDMLALITPHIERALFMAPSRLERELAGGTTILRHNDRPALRPQKMLADPLGASLCENFNLTSAEARVAVALSQGQSRTAAATALGITVNTVKTHVRRLYVKLGVSRHGELVHFMSRLRASQYK